MAAVLEYVNEREIIEDGSRVFIQAIDPSKPDSDFTFRIHRRMAGSPRNPGNDPVIEQSTQKSDSSGAVKLEWNVKEDNLKIQGPSVRYYVSLTVDNSTVLPSNNPEDFVLLNKQDAAIYDIVTSLGPIMAIPVYNEVSKDSGSKNQATVFDFTWDNWQPNYKPVIFLVSPDSDTLVESGYTVDYQNGKITFQTPVKDYQEVEASYVFGYFSKQQLMSMAQMALNDLNYVPPYTKFTIDNFPDYWRSMVVTGATLRCLEQIFIAPIFRERRLIFSDEDLNSALNGYYERLKSSFEAALQKKNRWSLTSPRGITGHDVIAPPRVSAHNFTQWAYLRGRGF